MYNVVILSEAKDLCTSRNHRSHIRQALSFRVEDLLFRGSSGNLFALSRYSALATRYYFSRKYSSLYPR